MNPHQGDAEFLKGIAGSFFAESQQLDRAMQQRPGNLDVGAHTLAKNLLELERELKHTYQQTPPQAPQATHIPMPQYVPPAPIGDPTLPQVPQQAPMPQYQPYDTQPPPQLEFNLDPDKQDVTNTLLKEISIKISKQNDVLTKLVETLQSKEDVKNTKSKKRGVPEVFTESGKD